MLLAQATQPTSNIWTPEVMGAITATIILVVGALGLAAVAIIKAGAARLEAKLAQQNANHATSQAAANTQNITALANQVVATTPPTGTGGISGTGPGGKIPLILLPLLLLIGAGGCLPVTSSDFDRLYAAKQAYQTSGALFEAALDNGVIKTQEQARPIQAARDAAKEILYDAQAKLEAGDKIGFNFVMHSFQVALGKFRQYLLRADVPDPQPQTRSDLWWTPRPSPSFSDLSRLPKSPESSSQSGSLCSRRLVAERRLLLKSTRTLTPQSLARTAA